MSIRSITPNKMSGITELDEYKITQFKRPQTSMKFSLQKIQQIGQSLNDILSKKKPKNDKKILQFFRDRFNQNMQDINTSAFCESVNQDKQTISKRKQNNTIYPTNYSHLGGTETERSHMNIKYQRESYKYLNNNRQNKNQIIEQHTNDGLRNQSLMWYKDNHNMNQCSLDYSKSENITTRNNRIRQNSQSTIQNFDHYILQSIAVHIQNDPNQTDLIICCQNYKLYTLNQYSKIVTCIGQHYRPIKQMTKIIIQANNKTFYTSSSDGQIIQWISDSMHGPFKYLQSIRIEEPPIQLHLDQQGSLYILTANFLTYQSYKIPLSGNVKCLSVTPKQIIIAIDNQIHQIIDDINNIQIIQLDKHIKTIFYEDQQLYILTTQKSLIVFDDIKNNLIFNSEIQLDADWVYAMPKNQIIILKDQNVIIQSFQKTRKIQLTDKITCLLPLSQQILIGDQNKTIKIIKL
ncbi:unnamed protein product [Paramecium pentaurelia]|uniref:Uncharacterized protein n=1 Tax=Paramecium pentaurelia TaxID=43138 RepID=A0A8S1SB06_9CILI|nr:unnamed protein product [Paramecium pentaurelia]